MARHVIRPRGARRKSLWLQFALQSTTDAGNSASIIFSLNAAALALRPFTIIRTHMSFFLRSDQAAANETQQCTWGAAIVSDQAVAVGITAVPTPDTEMGSSLFFARKIMFADGVALTDVTTPGQYFELDSKAQRKVEIGQDIVIVEENPQTPGYVLKMGGVILVKTN